MRAEFSLIRADFKLTEIMMGSDEKLFFWKRDRRLIASEKLIKIYVVQPI